MIADTQLRADRGVSPVVGVVLMVAVTVMLAAVITSFALGLGGQQSAPPHVDWELTYDGDVNVSIIHGGGEPVDPDTIRIEGDALDEPKWLSGLDDATWTVGDRGEFTIENPGESITLIWVSPSGEGAVLLERQLVPFG